MYQKNDTIFQLPIIIYIVTPAKLARCVMHPNSPPGALGRRASLGNRCWRSPTVKSCLGLWAVRTYLQTCLALYKSRSIKPFSSKSCVLLPRTRVSVWKCERVPQPRGSVTFGGSSGIERTSPSPKKNVRHRNLARSYETKGPDPGDDSAGRSPRRRQLRSRSCSLRCEHCGKSRRKCEKNSRTERRSCAESCRKPISHNRS